MMMFEEPKVELVKIDVKDVIATSAGSLETCSGPDAPQNQECNDEVWTFD